MKKVLAIVCLNVLMMFLALPAWSLTYSVDTLLAREILQNASDATEIAWAERIVGSLSGYDFYKDESYASLNLKYLDGAFWPGHSWDYAIVKVDGPNDYWYLFQDDNGTGNLLNGDDFLSTGLPGSFNNGFNFNAGNPAKGVSHVDFFGHEEQGKVPEPATMILFGSGLIALAGYGRRKILKK